MNSKVYVGNLSETTSKSEVENAFAKYGALKNVWLARKPPGFAFVEFDDNRDAEDAVRGLDGTKIGGSRVRVELSHGKSRRGGYQSSSSRRPSYRDSRDYRKDSSRRRVHEMARSRSRSLTNSRSRSR